MKSYRDTMEDLRFSPEDKAAMTQALLQAAAADQKKTRRRKKPVLIAVAAVLAALCAACATGVLQDAVAALSARFGSEPEQVELIQEFTQPVLASDTDNGVTITIEAVLGDSENSYILCRMERENGQPVLPQNEDTKNVANGDNHLMFEEGRLNSVISYGSSTEIPSEITGDIGASMEMLDFTPSDPVLYFVFPLDWQFSPKPAHEINLTLTNLYSHEFYYTTTPSSVIDTPPVDRDIPLVDGTWEFSFLLPQETQDISVELADGQTFLPGSGPVYPEVTIQSLRLTPFLLSLECTYTLDKEQTDAINALYDPVCQLPLSSWTKMYLADAIMETEFDSYITLTDGTQITFGQLGGSSGDATTPGQYSMTIRFKEVLPLDTIESVTIGDVTIPMSKE